MALYLLYGWIYYLVIHARCPVYIVYFTLILFPIWIFYENFADFCEYSNLRDILFSATEIEEKFVITETVLENS